MVLLEHAQEMDSQPRSQMKLGGAVCDSMSWMMELTNLVLDEELDTLDGGGGSLGDGSGDTTHCCPMLAIVFPCLPSSYRRRHASAVNAISRRCVRSRG